jgi:hypothetical protein
MEAGYYPANKRDDSLETLPKVQHGFLTFNGYEEKSQSKSKSAGCIVHEHVVEGPVRAPLALLEYLFDIFVGTRKGGSSLLPDGLLGLGFHRAL